MMRVERRKPCRRPSRFRGLQAIGLGAALTLLVPLACGVDKDRAPPPPPGAPNPGLFDASEGGGSSGATGAGGGAGNICACAAGIFAGDYATCASCIKAAGAHGQACESVRLACSADLGCGKIIGCLGSCVKDGGAVAACVDGCVLPLDADSAHKEYAALLRCACPLCAACAASSPIQCTWGATEADAGDADAASTSDAQSPDATSEEDADADSADATGAGG